MAKNETALDRLERTKVPSTEREYTLEEQMDSVSTDDFLDGMSDVAKDNLGHLFEEVTTKDDNTEPETTSTTTESVVDTQSPDPVKNAMETIISTMKTDDTDSADDELFNNNNIKPKRRSRKVHEEQDNSHEVSSYPIDSSSNPVLDQLAKDVIDDLRNRNHKINRFDDKSMEMIFDYMYSKF